MLVDELFIPHRAGTVRVPIHERVTVFAGLGETGRHRMARLFVGALAGAGPAYISMRDSSGDRALISTVGTRHADGRVVEGPVPTVEPTAGALERRMIVRAADLGLGPGRPDPFTVADRTAATIAHRQLVGELTAVEAGAAERAHLVAELGPPPDLDPGEATGRLGPDVAGRPATLVAAAPTIDRLLRSRQAAEDVLVHTGLALRAASAPETARELFDRVRGTAAATALLAAVTAGARMEARRSEPADAGTPADPATRGEADDVKVDVRSVRRRARAEGEAVRGAAEEDIVDCDRSLKELAGEAGVAVGAEGPGSALARALRVAPCRATPDDARRRPEDAARRIVARRRAMVEARIAELPTDDDVRAARRRLEGAAARLGRLDASDPAGAAPSLGQVRNALLGRAASLRPNGIVGTVPLLLDEPLVRIAPADRCDLLDVLVRISDRTQIVLLTDDPVTTTWARHHAERGELRLVDLAATAPSR